MQGNLLETKLQAPLPRRSLVARPRLTAALDRATTLRLTLVSAPPGFGKSSLLADWLRAPGHGWSGAWLSLEPADGNPAAYWPYLIASLERAIPGIGGTAPDRLSRAPIEAVLSDLINSLAGYGKDVVLLLDDYHAVDGPALHEGMMFLVDHLPANVHLVIATRADPGLPLARLRARGELVEIRAADLRFTDTEAGAYLNETMGLALDADAVEELETRTEGWVAALQLAALSIQGRADTRSFIARFAGDDRYVADYLADEVLRRQPEEVRSFLLQTSVLARLSAPLCDAVTGRGDARALLQRLERENLVVTALDDRRQWYRYHQLFADVLQAHLRDESAELVPDLHRRASAWFEAHGERDEAVRHAFEVGDIARAADLIERAIPELRRDRQEATLRRWIEALPKHAVQARPALAVTHVGALLTTGTFVGVEERIREAEEQLRLARSSAEPVRDDRRGLSLEQLASVLATYRSALARISGDEQAAVRHARRAYELAGKDDHLGRGSAAGLLGLTYWAQGDLVAAEDSWTTAAVSLQAAGHLSDVLGCSIAIGDIQATRGRLRAAIRTFERGLELGGETAGVSPPRSACPSTPCAGC